MLHPQAIHLAEPRLCWGYVYEGVLAHIRLDTRFGGPGSIPNPLEFRRMTGQSANALLVRMQEYLGMQE